MVVTIGFFLAPFKYQGIQSYNISLMNIICSPASKNEMNYTETEKIRMNRKKNLVSALQINLTRILQ